MLATQGLNNSVVGSAVAEMYAGCGELLRALQAFDRLPARDVVAWNALIAACCDHGHGEKALACFQKMQHEGIAPDAVTLLCALKASGSMGAAETGKDIHFRIVAGGFAAEADVVLGTALADMYAKCGLLQTAEEVFDRISARNAVSWNALIAGYVRLGDPSRAVELWQGMIRDGVEPTLATFAVVLSAYSWSGLLNQGQTYFRHMSSRYGLVPDLEHYTCMINLLGGAGCFGELVELIEQMPSSIDLHLPVCSTLLSACRRWGHVELASLAFGHAVRLQDEKSPSSASVCLYG
jgi:pentatricopeptide repeat protein